MENFEKKDILQQKKDDDTISLIKQQETSEIAKTNSTIIAEKIEDKIFELSDREKEKLKMYCLNDLKKVSIVQFNSLYNKLIHQIPTRIQIPPSEVIKPNEINTKNQQEQYHAPEKIAAPKTNISSFFQTTLSTEEQKIYGEIYIYHVLSSKTPLLEKTPMIWKLQETFLKIKNEYLRTKYPPTRAMRNFNPWNLKTNGDAGKDKGNYAIFSSLEKGWEALMNSIENRKKGKSKIYSPNFSLVQFFTKYASPAGAVAYANKAATIVNQITGLNVTPNKTPIKSIPTKALAAAIAEKEDGNCYRALKNEGFIK